MTSEDYRDVLIIIAGYPHDLDEMFKSNSGLKSRFTQFFEFPDWEPVDCVAFFKHCAEKENFAPLGDGTTKIIEEGFEILTKLAGFANGRDVKAVWEGTKSHRSDRVFDHPEGEGAKTIQLSDAKAAMESMVCSRRPKAAPLHSRSYRVPEKEAAEPSLAMPPAPGVPAQQINSKPVPRVATNAKEQMEEKAAVNERMQGNNGTKLEGDEDDGESCVSSGTGGSNGSGGHERQDDRDDGVPDEVWDDLVAEKQREREQELELERIRFELEERARLEEEARQAYEAEQRRIQEEIERQKEEERQKLEEERRRLEEEERRRRQAAEHARIQREMELQRIDHAKRQREKIRERLRQISPCPMGFNWHRQGSGWRCGGGSHYVSDAELQRSYSCGV